jgi:hypothetical protein
MDYKVKDSGQRQQFESGAVRDIQQNKGRYDLISPIALKYLAKHYESGALKYGDDNWLKGIPLKRIMDSALRHINNYLEGDRSENHLIACAWNCFAAFHTQQMIQNGTMPSSLMNLNCFIAEKDQDADTRKWWSEMQKLRDDAKLKSDDKMSKQAIPIPTEMKDGKNPRKLSKKYKVAQCQK